MKDKMAGGDQQKTVFVRNLAPEVDANALSAAFSEVGPIKQCILVTEGGKAGKHKGCGFVKFSTPEDAAAALKTLQGTKICGRALKLQPAKARPSFEERHKRKREWKSKQERGEAPPDEGVEEPMEKDAVDAPKKAPKLVGLDASEKHALTRCVALGNLTPACLPAALATVGELAPPERIQSEGCRDICEHAHLRADGCGGELLLLHYANPAAAAAAVKALHGVPLPDEHGNRRRTKGLPSPCEPDAVGIRLWARLVTGPGANVRRWRLILRNLPFSTTEKQVRALVASAKVFVWEVSLPRTPEGKPHGFGFLSFTSQQDAEAALSAANGASLSKRTVVADWAVSRSAYENAQGAQEDGEVSGEDGASSDSEGREGERDSEGATSGSEEVEDGEAGEGGDEDDQAERRRNRAVLADLMGEDADAAPDAGPAESKKKGAGEQAAKGAGDEAAEGAGDKAAKRREEAPPEEEASHEDQREAALKEAATMHRTVFVRGLPLDMQQSALTSKLQLYGPIQSCRLVRNKETGKLKGTAFVEYENGKDAARAAAACERGRKNEGPGISVDGRTINVDIAFTKEGAKSFAMRMGDSAAAAAHEKRNLYLAQEGQIAEDSEAWQGMSAGDQAKRRRARQETSSKLKSPNFFVSRNRLCIRNVPSSMPDNKLQELVIKAIQERSSRAQPKILQCHALRDNQKTGGDGEHLSRGIAFVELDEHEHAMAALRQLNNNPKVFAADRRPIVEFSVEDIKKVRQRERRVAAADFKRKRTSMLRAAEALEEGGGGDAEADTRRERKQRKNEARAKAKQKLAAKHAAKRARRGEGEEEGEAAGGQPSARQPKKQRTQQERVERDRPAPERGAKRARAAAREAQKAASNAAADAKVDRLAAVVPDGGGRRAKQGAKKKSISADDERLDSIVSRYAAALKGEGGKRKVTKASMSQWFEA